MQLISEVIYDILTEDADLSAILETVSSEGNIWHCRVPQNSLNGSDNPDSIAIYFHTYAVLPNDNKSGASEVDDVNFRVVIIGRDTRIMAQIARYVRYALDRWGGVVNDIPVGNIRFLNALFDPEGDYENEQQQWILEFKARVTDTNLRSPGAPVPTITPNYNYSEDEQVWPYSKWLNGETIYWKTYEIDSVNDYTQLDSPLPTEVGVVVDAKYFGISGVTGQVSEILGSNEVDGGYFQVLGITEQSSLYYTMWYTKI